MSKVKVAMSQYASDTCWAMSRERKIPKTPKLVVSLPSPREIMRTSFKVKGQRSKLPDRLMLRPEVRYTCRKERPTNFKLSILIENENPYSWQASDLQGQSRGSDVTCPISRECKVLETPKLVGRLPIPPSHGQYCTPVSGSKGQSSWSPGRLIMRPKVCHIFRIGRHTKLILVHRWKRRLMSPTRAMTSKV